MHSEPKYALTPLAAAVTAALYPGHQAVAQEESTAGVLEEIIVSARKRTESAQAIPASVQALSQDTLARMGAMGIDDYARFIPSINVVSYGSGQSVVVFRGATVDGGSYVNQSTSSVYLDEISLSSYGEQPEIPMYDIARVEALAGPQGTLYGSDAQAGTLRIVTNRPVMNTYEVIFDGSYTVGKQSDNSWDGSLVVNFPLVEDKLALRLVGFNQKEGGYIDNVFGHTPNFNSEWGDDIPAQWGSLDNAHAVEDDWNDAKTRGGRAQLRWEVNPDWAVTFGYSTQQFNGGAQNSYEPLVGDLKVVRFNNEWRKDDLDIYSLTIEADLGFAQLVSATSYYERDIKQQFDNTVYHHYWAIQYCRDATYYINPDYGLSVSGYVPLTNAVMYEVNDWSVANGYEPWWPYAGYYWTNPGTDAVVWWPVYCHAPTIDGDYLSISDEPGQQDKFTQEIRLSSQGDKYDWIVGAYYEKANNDWQSHFGMPTSNSYQQSMSLNYWEWYWDDSFPEATEQWYSESASEWDQTAVFGELTWHMSEEIDVTAGGRFFDRSNTNFYFVQHPTGQMSTENLDENGNDYVPANSGSQSEFVPKISVSYTWDDNKMLYGMWTQGYRPGGTNRSRGEPFWPKQYDSDLITNIEMGVKMLFAEGAGRFNATAFNMAWDDFQIQLIDPTDKPCTDEAGEPLLPESVYNIPGVCGQPWQTVVANGGDAHIRGLSVELDYAPSDSVTLGMNAEWLEAETDTTLDLDGDGELDVLAGNRLPIVPEFKWSAWGEYHRAIDANLDGFVRLQWSYTGDSNNILEPINALQESSANPQFRNKAYNIGDLRVGVRGEDWEVNLYVNNLTDERAQLTHGTGQYEYNFGNSIDGRSNTMRVYTVRPREYGLRFMKRWGD